MAVHPEPMDPHQLLRRVLSAALAIILMLAGGANPASAAPRDTTTTLSLSHTSLFKGEMTWLKGKVTTRSGKGVKGVKVRLERRVDGGRWRKVATLKTRKNGTFSQRQRPAKEYTYRARVLGSSKVAASSSSTRAVHFVKGTDRGLGKRAKLLRSVLGKGKRAVRTIKVKGTDRVRFREYAKGMLVEVKKNGERRTWLVYGDIYRAYRKAGGPKGKLGVPTGDPRCGLPEAGCIQRFTKAAIYDNKSTKGVVQTGKGRRAEILAVARSQVGYSPSRKNATKYNKWVGSVGQAWCSSFLSWVSYAAGTGKTIPKHKRLTGLLKDIRENKVMKTGSKPKKGALVFFDTFDDGVVEATHVGIVVKVKSSTIVTVEANTSNPKNSSQRGVYQKERQRSRALFYAYPEY